ncbi:unnamed protein product [Rotaria socialis]|uniref:Endonuclease/exonuclease/phosphatase domain-containing protein n=1 Tax=Rotaria socialis TaxID=392032 RepID=A0A818FVQ6_9BILA|nr:unnamed protein product [Rotaria socialis]CAF3228205.1 unnamed protein product [Rotaria socialis]CAF3480603.1 unnamed protein product [Rotaria socialis]CAF3525180.1 unnamed protein product [Rotaria socialis]CAF3734631.1 unnamed protein product [Rotaria socialis]
MSSVYTRRKLSNFTNNKNDTLSVCTFNVLAPCYKRLSSEYDRESSYDTLWQKRHLSIINLLQSLDIHLICLQEFWFKNPSFIQLYKSNLLSKYSFYTLRRTGLLDDGLAILVDSNHFKVLDKYELILNDIGDRIGLLLNLEFNGKNLLLINIHLTFPHHRFESRLRLKQMKKFLELIHNYQISKNLLNKCTLILCGDFNSSYHKDDVYQLIDKQFQSSYKFIHGNEPNVTHLTHRNEQLGVDFIFYKSDILLPVSSELIPRGCNSLTWSDQGEWNLSDHRAILTMFKYKNNQ